MKNKIILFFFILLPSLMHSSILSDLTKDNIIIIDLDKDATNDNSDDNSIEEAYYFGNKWFSRNNIFISLSSDMGMSGAKDFFSQNFLFKFRFKSRNKHAFAIRTYQMGYAPGIFSGNMTFYNFAILGGFEYLFKIFSSTEGFFLWTDIGGCNEGFALTLGLGAGSRVKNGFELYCTYLYNVGAFTKLEFYFLIFNILTIRGKLGIDFTYHDYSIDIFTFLGGAYIGVFVKDTFRIEVGGGFTVNDYAYFSGFGSVSIAFQFL